MGAGNEHKWGPIAVVIAALIGAIALLISNIPNIKKGLGLDGTPKQLSGTVSNAKSKAPLEGVVVQLQTPDGKPLKQATTDGAGHYSMEIPGELTDIRLVATKTAYVPYGRTLPAAQSLLHNIDLERMPLTIGYPDGVALWKDLEITASKLNVAIVFSPSCTQKAQSASVAGAELPADLDVPETVIQALIDRVKDSKFRYRVGTIEPRGRYEIACY
jgi:hypothetical protein